MKTWLLAAGILEWHSPQLPKCEFVQQGQLEDEVLRTRSVRVFYGTLVSFKQTNTEIVRFNVDDVVMRMTRIRSSEKPGCHDEVPI